MEIPDLRHYRPADDLLWNRKILITGATGGIGRAVTLAFARHGAELVLLGRTAATLEALSGEIVAAGGVDPSMAVMDLAAAQGPAYFDLVSRLTEVHGRLDGLVHLAGILGDRSPIEHYDIGSWHQVMHLNLNAPFILTKLLMPLLLRAGQGSVIFTSSGVGRRGRAYWGAYAVSKFGVEGLTQVLADETSTGKRLRVNAINPGPVRTAMRRAAYPTEDPSKLREPEDVVGPYLFLAGPESVDVTGQSLDCPAA